MRFTSGGEKSKKYILEASGSGVAFVDFDNDGWVDIFLVNGSRIDGAPHSASNHLYRNLGNGKFSDVTAAAGLDRGGWGGGVCAGDYDNDGNIDLYVTYWGRNVLYRNTGRGNFEDVTVKARTGGPPGNWGTGCTFIDYDRDGKLDLFTTSYLEFDLAAVPAPGKGTNCEWKGMPVLCGPRGLPYGTAVLYHNLGGGAFENVTRASRISEAKGFYAFTSIAADLNEDGWTDLYVAADSTPSLFFRNNRDGTFSEIGTETGLAFNEHGFEQAGMGTAAGDFNLDGSLDVIKTNFSGDHPNVYQNLGKGIFEDVVLKAGLGVNPQYVGWGVALADLDNDGLQDVFQVNGHVYLELEQAKMIEKFFNPRLVYRNLGKGRFEDVSALAGPGVAEKKSSRGAAVADFDNDGDLDILIMNMSDAPSLLRNDLPKGPHWLQLRLEGRTSNRSAIGAKVTIEAAGAKQTLPVLSQSSYISQNDFRLHFGLARAAGVEKIHVVWPNGNVEEFPGVAADRIYHIVEGSGAVKPWSAR
ncbi:MAG: CRTAC1 family protein [Bryobacterales bacterium]|nr:CRTAC1 family protein [Bryobacterales bacterium]